VIAHADQVLAAIDSEALARDCLAFVAVQSETGREGPGSLFLADLMRQGGCDVEVDQFLPDRPNVSACLPGCGGGPTLLFNGHVDTIPIGKCWPPRRDGEWIWGRGAEDMKAGLVAMAHAVRAIRKAGVRLCGDLWLTGVVGHETPIGKKEGPKRLIQRIRGQEIRPHAILIGEGPAAIWTASLGSAIFTISLESDRAPVHTSKVPYKENPVRSLAALLQEIDRLDDQLSSSAMHLAGRDQVNVGIVSAGDYFNRLPVRLTVTGTRRWAPGHTAEEIRAELAEIGERVARAAGLHSRLELEGVREPFHTPSDHPLVQALRRAGQQLAGVAPEIIGLAVVGDANSYANEAGVPTVYYGPAYATAHSDEERVSVSQLVHIARMYALTAMAYCGVSQ